MKSGAILLMLVWSIGSVADAKSTDAILVCTMSDTLTIATLKENRLLNESHTDKRNASTIVFSDLDKKNPKIKDFIGKVRDAIVFDRKQDVLHLIMFNGILYQMFTIDLMSKQVYMYQPAPIGDRYTGIISNGTCK